MHDALKKEFPIESFENGFKNSKPYVDTSFSSVSMENNVTVLKGTAKTEDGCSSLLDFKILDGKIISFNISPLCLNWAYFNSLYSFYFHLCLDSKIYMTVQFKFLLLSAK